MEKVRPSLTLSLSHSITHSYVLFQQPSHEEEADIVLQEEESCPQTESKWPNCCYLFFLFLFPCWHFIINIMAPCKSHGPQVRVTASLQTESLKQMSCQLLSEKLAVLTNSTSTLHCKSKLMYLKFRKFLPPPSLNSSVC